MNYKPIDVLTGGNIFKEYNEPLIRKYLDLLTLDNLNIYFISKFLKKNAILQKKYMELNIVKKK